MSCIRSARLSVVCVGAIVLVGWAFLCATDSSAQEKRKMTYKALGANTKYTKQHIIEVRDIPGHQIRIHEIHRAYPADAPLKYDGVAVKESYEWTLTDYVNWTGRHRGYSVSTMENGDKIYSEYEGTTHTTLVPEGGAKGKFWGLTTITGGTGKFAGIRGNIKYDGIFDPTINLNEVVWEIEYWLE